MTELQQILLRLKEQKQYPERLVKLIDIILESPDGRVDTMARNKVLEAEGIRRISDVKEYSLPLVLDFANACLEDGVITADETKAIKLLKAYFGIEDGDFYKNGWQKEVKAVLFLQLKMVYEDGKVTEQEALLQSETQGLFGLSYNEWEEIVKAYFNN